MEWLEPAIEKRINDVFDRLYENEDNDKFKRIFKMMASLNYATTNSNEIVFEFENAFILQFRKFVDTSYREGLKDGISLSK